ncbi:MAG TPA: hypothetical protein VFX96_01520 [Pyrinomonadaceae bacterium]|nr:hypothetical protein [Pyrinomonadaceae bacterium]
MPSVTEAWALRGGSAAVERAEAAPRARTALPACSSSPASRPPAELSVRCRRQAPVAMVRSEASQPMSVSTCAARAALGDVPSQTRSDVATRVANSAMRPATMFFCAARAPAVIRSTSNSAGASSATGAPHRRQKRESSVVSVPHEAQAATLCCESAMAAMASASRSMVTRSPRVV